MALVPETSKPLDCGSISTSTSAPTDFVVVGMGGNQGDVLRCFFRVLEHFEGEGRLLSVSSLYRSAPVGPQQPDFFNAAFALSALAWRHDGSLILLLRELQGLEANAQRVRKERWGPRTLDLDLLWAGLHEESTPELTVPHPRLAERRFAILPLLDLVPHARLPGASEALSSVVAGIVGQPVERVGSGRWWEAQAER